MNLTIIKKCTSSQTEIVKEDAAGVVHVCLLRNVFTDVCGAGDCRIVFRPSYGEQSEGVFQISGAEQARVVVFLQSHLYSMVLMAPQHENTINTPLV